MYVRTCMQIYACMRIDMHRHTNTYICMQGWTRWSTDSRVELFHGGVWGGMHRVGMEIVFRFDIRCWRCHGGALIAVHDRCPCEAVLRPPAVGERADGVVEVGGRVFHTHTNAPTHTHIRAHKYTCRKAAEVCLHRKENIR